jgi:hypothetical protein
MAEKNRRHPGPLAVSFGLALVAAGGLFAWRLLEAQRLPTGPVPIVWDQEACAQCKMHIGDPAFAAQVQLGSGEVLDFDDPGCLFTWVAAHEPEKRHAVWFHHHGADRWLAQAEVGFVPASPTPMDYGLAAVERSAAGAKSFDEVLAEFRARAGRTAGRLP